MKKTGALILILLVSLVSSIIVSAQNDTLTIEEKAISCLENKIEDKCSELALEEQVFSLLAVGKCKSELKEKSKDNECWPSPSCEIKETALAILALDYEGDETGKAEKWLLNHNTTSSDLEWYLEIDSSGETKCTISANEASRTITINEDKTISGNPGNCFSLAYNNYWLRIENNCLKKDFTVSCDRDFISTLLYKESLSSVWHISSEIESASAGGVTEHKVDCYCFSTSSECDYEGSLWAALALQKTDNEISGFLPYLIALAEDSENEKFFPSAFLYILTNSEEYLQKIIALQEGNGYWDLGEKGKHYDTALALLSLPESEAEILAKTWLEETQDSGGCWNNNIRDTGFLLWTGWPREPTITPGISKDYCEDFNYYCTTKGECDRVQGSVLDNFYCPGLKICCDTPPLEKTCQEKEGVICPSGQVCDISVISASDTNECCLGNCKPELYECEQYNYFCRASCLDDEEETLLDCPSGKVCCKEKIKPEKSYWWIWLLVVLIILVILGIVFKDNLRIWIFKLKGRFGKGPTMKGRPPFPPTAAPGGLRRMIPITAPRPAPTKIARPKGKTKTEKELEETLKKLKEIGK